MTQGERPVATELGPGIHILENNPIGVPSPKASNVRTLLEQVGTANSTGDSVLKGLHQVLADHSILSDTHGLPEGVDPRVLAACVHTERYGTRSAALVSIPADPGTLPRLLVADGPPCTSPSIDVSGLWSA
jgi:uncharacterized protein with NRDE domain